MSLFVTYNVLAQAYVLAERYPGVNPQDLLWERRLPALLTRIVELAADVVCLQEVEEVAHQAVAARLGALGYQAHYVKKAGRAADGCATYSRLPVLGSDSLHYSDGSGHVALLVTLQLDGSPALIANTHLKWDRSGWELAWAQLDELSPRLREDSVVCGDFNVTPDSPALLVCSRRGFYDALGPDASSVIAGRAKKIDYLFHGPSLHGRPGPVAPLSAFLPNATDPSDHLPMAAYISRPSAMVPAYPG